MPMDMRRLVTFLLVFSIAPTLLLALAGWIARSTTLSILAVLLVGILVDRWLRQREQQPPPADDGDSA
jgi:membrane protein implicated in regulation of membrane protease activity